MSQTWTTLQEYPEITGEELDRAKKQALSIVSADLPVYRGGFISAHAENGVYQKTDNTDWTTGFWSGILWLSYELTGNEDFKKEAMLQADSFRERLDEKIDVNHHDMGFLYSLSCVACHKLTGDEKAKETALMAARHLAGRFQEKGQFLQAWKDPGDPKEYRMIIDCLLNLPLLFWAAEVSGEAELARRALAHLRTAMEYLIREDGSTCHTYFFDPQTGAPSHQASHQGNRAGSAWSRGQAWGMYGIALGYRYTKEEALLSCFDQVSDYFLSHLPADLIPYWDFDFDDGSGEPRDSSALAIAVCGLLEMAAHVPEEKAKAYEGLARRYLAALVETCANSDLTGSNGLLLHGTRAKGTPGNSCTSKGIDTCNAWGDYFYLEALVRMSGGWELYW